MQIPHFATTYQHGWMYIKASKTQTQKAPGIHSEKKRISKVKNLLLQFQRNTVLLYCYSSVRNKSVCKIIQQSLSSKGQLISKANCQVVDSPKKLMDGFVFFCREEQLRSKVKSRSFLFLGESSAWRLRQSVFDLISPLATINVKKQTLPELYVHIGLFGTLE